MIGGTTGYRLNASPLSYTTIVPGFDFVLSNDLDEFVEYLDKAPRVTGPPLNYRFRHTIQEAEFVIMEHAATILMKAPRIDPQLSCKSRIVSVLRHWSKYEVSLSDWEKERFKTEFTAYRLGITSNNLRASPGLANFIEKDFTYNTLAFYKHTLRVTSPQSPVQILMDENYVDWSEAKKSRMRRA